MFPFLQRSSESIHADPERYGWMVEFANRLKTEPGDVSRAVDIMTAAIASSTADRWGKKHFLERVGIAEHVPVDPSDPTVNVDFRHDMPDAVFDIPKAFRAGYRDRFENVPGVSVELQPVPSGTDTQQLTNVTYLDDYRQRRQQRIDSATSAVMGSAQPASTMSGQLDQASGF